MFQNHTEYKRYLETNKSSLGEDLFKFLVDEKRYDLGSDSLHDSWLQKIEIIEEKKTINISMTFLGPYHDRYFKFTFNDVVYYELSQKQYDRSGHGDVSTFNVLIDERENLSFTLYFETEETYYVVNAKRIAVQEEYIIEK